MAIVGATPAAQLMADLARNYEITRQTMGSVLDSTEQRLTGRGTVTSVATGSMSSTSPTSSTQPVAAAAPTILSVGRAGIVMTPAVAPVAAALPTVTATGSAPAEVAALSGGPAPYTGLLGTSLGAGVAVIGGATAMRYLPLGAGVGSDDAPYRSAAPGATTPSGSLSVNGGPGGGSVPSPGGGPGSTGSAGGLGAGVGGSLGSGGGVSSASGLGSPGGIAGVADRPAVPAASPGLSVMSNGVGATTVNSPLSGGGAGAAASAGRMGGMGGMGMMGGGMGAGGEGGSGRRIPPWLVETENVWGESSMVTPAVIGDDVVTAPPPGRAGSLPRSGVAR